MRKNVTWKSIILVCIIGLFLTGCAAAGSKIMMKQGKYTPSFRSGDYSRYKGKKLILDAFTNQAGNTKAWSYNSADNKYMYEGDAQLEGYYWYCFQKAFRHIGVNIVDYSYGGGPHPYGYHHGYGWGYAPPPEVARAARGVPEFALTLTFLTDQEFSFKVYVYKNGETKLEKDFTVKMSVASTENVADLEKRSYRLVDLAFTTIMKDKDFQRVF
jgi:hydroxyacyl-ACP dehydratase HTD2-like protein with hotdog domain